MHTHTCTMFFCSHYYTNEHLLAGGPWFLLSYLFLECVCCSKGPNHHILDRMPAPWMTPLSCSISLHFHAPFDPVGIILTFNMAKPSWSTFLIWFLFQQFSDLRISFPCFQFRTTQSEQTCFIPAETLCYAAS